MATLQTIRAAAESLGFETEYKPPLLTVTLLFRIRLQVREIEGGTKTRLKYGPYPEWLWEVITALPVAGLGYYLVTAKHLGKETLVVVALPLLFLACVGVAGVLVGHRKRQLLARAHQLEIAGAPVELSGV